MEGAGFPDYYALNGGLRGALNGFHVIKRAVAANGRAGWLRRGWRRLSDAAKQRPRRVYGRPESENSGGASSEDSPPYLPPLSLASVLPSAPAEEPDQL